MERSWFPKCPLHLLLASPISLVSQAHLSPSCGLVAKPIYHTTPALDKKPLVSQGRLLSQATFPLRSDCLALSKRRSLPTRKGKPSPADARRVEFSGASVSGQTDVLHMPSIARAGE